MKKEETENDGKLKVFARISELDCDGKIVRRVKQITIPYNLNHEAALMSMVTSGNYDRLQKPVLDDEHRNKLLGHNSRYTVSKYCTVESETIEGNMKYVFDRVGRKVERWESVEDREER